MNVFRSYANYLKKIDELKQIGVIDDNYKKKSFFEWHLDDFADRVEDYFVSEFMEIDFIDYCYIGRSSFEGDELYDFIWQIIEYNYLSYNNIVNTAGMIRDNLRTINILKDYST